MPKVSIVVPTYNVEMYLRECLESLINQTLKDIEIICVNDGSTDNSLDILNEYASKDSRIKIISKDNSGYGHTMNIGIDAATGEFLGIVEPDDYVALDMYESLYEIAKKVNAEIVKADFYRFVNERNLVNRTYNQLTKYKDFYNKIINPAQEQIVFKFIMNTWSGIYDLEFLRKHNIRHNETPGASFQDNGFWFQGFCLSDRVYFVDKAYYMNRRDNPNSSVHNKEKVYCANKEYEFIKNFLFERGLYDKFKDVYVMKLWHNCWFTYNRIGKEFKLEYLKSIAKLFSEFIENNQLKDEYFSKNELFAISKIVCNQRMFYWQYSLYSLIKNKLGGINNA